MGYVDKEADEKAKEAEESFQLWLNKHKIHYLYIKQDIKSFPKAFKEDKLKRPDFIVLLPNIGFIMVDVKHREVMKKYNDIGVDSRETEKYAAFQNLFHIPIWYAFSCRKINYKKWYWIPLSKVLELDLPVFDSSKSTEPYSPVKVEEFITVEDSDSLANIFSRYF